MEKTYHSNGKLLLTGEYLVLDGAKSLAIPTKLGQSLKVSTSKDSLINWTSYNSNNEVWLSAKLELDFSVLETSNTNQAEFLISLLRAARELNPEFVKSGVNITTHLEFSNDWGLGSSSTLISNVAQWAEVDPFELHFKVSNGSGYDIACATSQSPLLYTLKGKPEYKNITWIPSFSDQIYFIHLNQKQRSHKEVQRYSLLKESLNLHRLTDEVSQLTDRMITAKDLGDFEDVCKEHEYILSSVLQIEPIKEHLFQMYQGGIVKSLGAWGGDFVMVSAQNEEDLEYFRNKGYDTIVKFEELLLV